MCASRRAKSSNGGKPCLWVDIDHGIDTKIENSRFLVNSFNMKPCPWAAVIKNLIQPTDALMILTTTFQFCMLCKPKFPTKEIVDFYIVDAASTIKPFRKNNNLNTCGKISNKEISSINLGLKTTCKTTLIILSHVTV